MRSNEQADTQLIQQLKKGDREAANLLIERYFDRVVRAAERQLHHSQVFIVSGDDIAASVFESLWKRAKDNGFHGDELQDSKELWRLLCKMIQFKSRDHIRRASAKKRGGHMQLQRENQDHRGNSPLEDVRQEFAADELAIFKEEHLRMLKLLDNDFLVQIAIMRLEGYSVLEIADEFEKSERWVGRKLALIRKIWRFEIDSTGPS